VELEELRLFLAKEKHRVYGQRKGQFSHLGNREFWNPGLCEYSPVQQLAEQAAERLVVYKVQQQAMRQEGIVDDISFSGFLTILSSENHRRLQDKQDGKPIYGPVQYQMESYYEILHDNRMDSLKKLWAKKELSETQLKEYYHQHSEEFVQGKIFQIRLLLIPDIADGVRQLLEQFLSGNPDGTLDQLFQVMRAICPECKIEEHQLHPRTEQRSTYTAALRYAAEQTSVCGLSKPLSFPDRLAIVSPVSKNEGELVPYPEARTRVYALAAEEFYQRRVAGLVEQAELLIDNDALIRMAVSYLTS